MATQNALFQTVFSTVQRITAGTGLHKPVLTQVAVFVTAMAAARSTVQCRIAEHVVGLQLTKTEWPKHAERSLSNTLDNPQITMAAFYHPLVREAIPWDEFRQKQQPVILIIDESNRNATEHLLRCSLAVWGDALPLASRLWVQNRKLKRGAYWQAMDELLAEVRTLLPPDLEVIVLADRAYDIPPVIDRLRARHWHFVIRLKATSSVRYRDPVTGTIGELKVLILRYLAAPGTKWTAELDLFKKANWRRVRIQGVWAVGQKEPLVVISDLPAKTGLIALYEQRFWIEASFRHEKSLGLEWEASGIQGLERHERLLVLMAWVMLLALTEGLVVAVKCLERRSRVERRAPVKAHPTQSVFRLGLARLTGAMSAGASALQLILQDLCGPSWSQRYKQAGVIPKTFAS